MGEVEKAILNEYHHDTPESLYRTIKTLPYYGVMHDRKSKLGKEFNGLYIHEIDESYEPINVPYHPSKMKG